MTHRELFEAAEKGEADRVRALVKETGVAATINAAIRGKTPLMAAAAAGFVDVVAVLLVRNPSFTPPHTCTPLNAIHARHWPPRQAPPSCSMGSFFHSFILILSLSSLSRAHQVLDETDANKSDARGATALIMAAMQNRVDVVKAMLGSGRADPNRQICLGHTALTCAAQYGQRRPANPPTLSSNLRGFADAPFLARRQAHRAC